MPNPYFQFKQFTVQQDRCAMKVTTDGCLFGAWASKWMADGGGQMVVEAVEKGNNLILDIGAGTGLLSLMVAQKNGIARIDAVEIDEQAAVQCRQNFEASPWKERLSAHCSSIQHFAAADDKKYDRIISNPPFYEQQLKGTDIQKNMAHHSSGLGLEELFVCVQKSLKPNGFFLVLLPFYRLEETIEIATGQHLFLQQKTFIKQTPKHVCFRAILVFSTIQKETIVDETIVIKDEGNVYSERFVELLKDYYWGL